MHPGGPSAPGDPNAAFCIDGTYHLHYIVRHPWMGEDSFSFVHVTSPDMLHWEWQPTALQPSFTGHGMFSGTGFFTKNGTPAVIYHGKDSGRNQIAVARNRDLSAWEPPYPIEVSGPEDLVSHMRHWDPDCFLIGDTYYSISGGKEQPLFKSDDLKTWTYVGPFVSHQPADVVKGEDISCPNFFRLGDKWVLLCISHPYGCRYYIGDWDAEKEQFVPEKHDRMNWAHAGQGPIWSRNARMWDFFAPESLLTSDGRRVMWAWMCALAPELQEKTIQSLPRELSLDGKGDLRIRPLRELESLRQNAQHFEPFTVEPEDRPAGGIGTQHIFDLPGSSCEIRVTVSRAEADRKRFGIRLFTGDRNEGLPIVIDPATATLQVGTTHAPFTVASLPSDEDVELRIFIDKYIVEVFVNDRQAVAAAHLNGREARGVDAYTWGAPTTFGSIGLWTLQPTNQGYRIARKSKIWQPDTGSIRK